MQKEKLAGQGTTSIPTQPQTPSPPLPRAFPVLAFPSAFTLATGSRCQGCHQFPLLPFPLPSTLPPPCSLLPSPPPLSSATDSRCQRCDIFRSCPPPASPTSSSLPPCLPPLSFHLPLVVSVKGAALPPFAVPFPSLLSPPCPFAFPPSYPYLRLVVSVKSAAYPPNSLTPSPRLPPRHLLFSPATGNRYQRCVRLQF